VTEWVSYEGRQCNDVVDAENSSPSRFVFGEKTSSKPTSLSLLLLTSLVTWYKILILSIGATTDFATIPDKPPAISE